MTSPIRTERHDNVLVVISDNPPVNALGQAVRAGLKDAIEEALADDGVEAVVIRCDGQTFFAGADITEFGKPPVGPNLPETLDAMEASDKPVVAAIHGTALGGGCEVALACHYRVAVPSAKMGLPEVKLGLIPGAAGTQRLPRLIGAEAALPLVVGGNPIPAKKAEAIGLLASLGWHIGRYKHPMQHLDTQEVVDHCVHLNPLGVGGGRVVVARKQGTHSLFAQQPSRINRLITQVVIS